MRHLWLVGMMGSGKTETGRLIAQLAGCAFVDTDERVVLGSGRSISAIFGEDSESEFRSMEEIAIRSAAAEPAAIISTGGGAVLNDANVQVMHSSGTVVYLAAGASTLAARVGEDMSRPLLQGRDPLAAMTELLRRREALYRAAAHFTIQTDDRDPEEVAQEAIALWNES